jgi:ubiquinone/menaquinone biosynthesis C-methylase UbiE
VDVGTGSGRWVIEVADQFPSAKVCGVDLSPIHLDENDPKNAEFVVMDLTEGLKFEEGSVDLVHSRSFTSLLAYNRMVHGGLTESQWPSYMKEIYRILKHGKGWAQCAELSPPFAYSENGKLPQESALGEVSFSHSNWMTLVSSTYEGSLLC